MIDTHVLVWWLAAPDKLSSAARKALRGVNAKSPAVVSAISVLEIATAARRGRLALSMPADDWLRDVGLLPEVRIEPVTAEIARCAGTLDDSLHGDPADRIIVATARTLACRLVSADDKLRSHPDVRAVW
ncbi:MAG: type II toxin-antitoxin system VapC family toxin [Burkholderiales bacterium]